MRNAKYVDYINNTGFGRDEAPLPVAHFDEDHEPIGPMVRAQMLAEDLIQIRGDGIVLRPDLARRAGASCPSASAGCGKRA